MIIVFVSLFCEKKQVLKHLFNANWPRKLGCIDLTALSIKIAKLLNINIL